MRTHPLRLSLAIGLASLMIMLVALIVSPSVLGRPIESTALLSSRPAGDANVLINPDFESGYAYPLPCCNNIAVPVGWNIRWYTDVAAVVNNITYTFKQPEVKIIDSTKWPFCDDCAPNIPPRIHSGGERLAYRYVERGRVHAAVRAARAGGCFAGLFAYHLAQLKSQASRPARRPAFSGDTA